MADIQTYLNNIMKAVLGKDVRQAIHDSIKQCYYDGKAGAIDLDARERAAAAEARMDTFTKLPSGSTSANAELVDIRDGLDGITYSTAGTAVREQLRNTNTIEVKDAEPTKENTQLWIRPSENSTFNLPEIKDYDVNPDDTWSSEKISTKIEELYNEVFYVPETRNYYNPALQTEDTISPHYYFKGEPYETSQFDDYYHATDFIEIEPNTRYTIGLVPAVLDTANGEHYTLPWARATSGLFFYDRNKKYISTTTDGTFITPIDAKYIRFNYARVSKVFLNVLNSCCMLVKGHILPDSYIPYEDITSVKNVLEATTSGVRPRIAYRVGMDSITLSAKYDNDTDIQYFMSRKGGNNLFDFYRMYLCSNTLPIPAIHDIGDDVTPFISGGGDWHAPFQIRALDNIDGDQPGNIYFTGGNHQYNNGPNGSTPTAESMYVEFYSDGVRLSDGDTGYSQEITIAWANKVQGYNTTKVNGTGRAILEERHQLIFDGHEFKSHVELEPLENILCVRYYGFQFFNSTYDHIRYVDGANRYPVAASEVSESGNDSTTLVRAYNSQGHTLEMELDPTFDLGKRETDIGTNSAFTTGSRKTYFSIIDSNTQMYEGYTYSLRGTYRFKRSNMN